MDPSPLGLGPRLEHTPKIFSSPNPMVDPYSWKQDRSMPIMYGLVGGCTYPKQPMTSATWYRLREYRCQTTFWRLEPVLMPLPLFLM